MKAEGKLHTKPYESRKNKTTIRERVRGRPIVRFKTTEGTNNDTADKILLKKN